MALEFHEYYKYMLLQHPRLTSISEDRASAIQKDIDNYKSIISKELYYPMTFIVVLMVLSFGVLFLSLNDYLILKVGEVMSFIESKKYFFDKNTMVNSWLLVIFTSSFSYMWLIPALKLLYHFNFRFNSGFIVKMKRSILFFIFRMKGRWIVRVNFRLKKLMSSILINAFDENIIKKGGYNPFNIIFLLYTRPKNTLDWFVFFTLNIFMLISFSVLMKGHAYLPDSVIEATIYLIMCIPMILVLFMLMLVVAFLMTRSSFMKSTIKINNSRAISALLGILRDADEFYITKVSIESEILEKVDELKALVSAIAFDTKSNSVMGLFIRSRVNLIVSYIDEIKLDIILPNDFSEYKVKNKIYVMMNSFLDMKYGEITKDAAINKVDYMSVTESAIKGSNVFSFVFLSLLIGLPIMLWLVLNYFVKLEVDEVSKNLLAILYTIWSVLCIISHLHKLAPEAKELLMGTIKMFVPKGDK